MNARSYIAIFITFLFVLSPLAWAADDGINARVMTRNVYVGANVFAAFDVDDPADFPAAAGDVLAEIIRSDFLSRAERIAQEIRQQQPHAIGLQEVWNIQATPQNGGAPIAVDYLEVLMAALASQGQRYVVAVVQTQMDLTLPALLPDDQGRRVPYFGSVQDRTVILVRHNVAWANAASGLYETRFSTDFGFDVVRGWNSIDLVFAGNPYRFVNTHLEPESIAEGLVQTAQAFELRAKLAELASLYGSLPEVVVGDFNSDPDDLPCTTPLCELFGVAGFTPYTVLTSPVLGAIDPVFGAPLVDAWELRNNEQWADGKTCCLISLEQDGLDGIERRVDLILIRDATANGVTVRLTGDDAKRKTQGGFYGSDHLGVFGRMTLIPAH